MTVHKFIDGGPSKESATISWNVYHEKLGKNAFYIEGNDNFRVLKVAPKQQIF